MTMRFFHVCDTCRTEVEGGVATPADWLTLQATIRGTRDYTVVGSFCSPACLRNAFAKVRFAEDEVPPAEAQQTVMTPVGGGPYR